MARPVRNRRRTTGMLEGWNIGENEEIGLDQYSNTPILHYSRWTL
jgi:hypothetical protein